MDLLKNQKVLIIGQIPPPVHGANIMAEILLGALRQLGHEAVLVSKTFSQTMADVERINLRKILAIFLIVGRLWQAVTRNTFNLCFYFITMKFRAFLVDALFLLILRFFGIPYILYCHGQGLQKLGATGPCWKRWLVRHTLAGAAGALVLGERLKEDISLFIDEQRVYVLPNALPDQAQGWQGKRSLEQPACRILFLANLIKTKGPREFLLMARTVADRELQARFLVAGLPVDEHFYQSLRKFIEDESLADKVKFLGGVFGEDKNKIYRESDIFVYPTHRDAFPLVILEAMQWSLPVISANEGAIPEVVIDGVTGYVVNPTDIYQLTDRVLKLVRDATLRQQMGEAGRRRYKDFYSIAAYQQNLQQALHFFAEIIAAERGNKHP